MSKVKKGVEFPLVNFNACGIDVGSRSHWVSIGLSKNQTQRYGVFTEDLYDLCKWVQSQGVKTVAMERVRVFTGNNYF